MKIYTEEEWRHYITMRYMVGDERIKPLVLQDGVYQDDGNTVYLIEPMTIRE